MSPTNAECRGESGDRARCGRPEGNKLLDVQKEMRADGGMHQRSHEASLLFSESSQRLCAKRLLTAETQVTLTLSQPSPTAKSLTPHRTRHTSGHVSAQRTPDTRALPAPGLRRADSGADHFASCLAFSHAMRFTLSRLSLSTARAARYQLSHAHSRMRLVV